MSKATPILVLLALIAAVAGGDEKSSGIEWGNDLEKALAQSKKDGRPVLAYFTFET
jgi:hypothetical protein